MPPGNALFLMPDRDEIAGSRPARPGRVSAVAAMRPAGPTGQLSCEPSTQARYSSVTLPVT